MKRILLASALGAAISFPLPANAVNPNPGNLPRDNGARGDRSRDDRSNDDRSHDRDNKPDKRDDKPVVVKVDQPPRRDDNHSDRGNHDRPTPRDGGTYGGGTVGVRPTTGFPGDNRPGNRDNNRDNNGPFGNRPPRPGNGGGPVYPPGIPSPGHGDYKGNSHIGNPEHFVGHPEWNNHGHDDHYYRDHDWGHRDNRWDYSSTRTVIINRDIYVPTYPYYPDPVYVEPRDPYLDDLEVEARQIKNALRNDRDLEYCQLDTDTVGYSIEVEGYVDNPDQLQRILDVSRDIDPNVRIVITRVKIR